MENSSYVQYVHDVCLFKQLRSYYALTIMYAFLLLFFFLFWRCLHFTSHMVCSMVKKIDCHSPPFDIDLSRQKNKPSTILRYICENLIQFHKIIAPFGKNAFILYVSHRIAYIVSHKMHGDFIRPLISDGRRRCGRLKVFGRKKARQFL